MARGPKKKADDAAAEGMPSCPGYLDANAQVEWRRVLPLLHSMHGVGMVDRAVVSIYCAAYSDVLRLEAFIREHGETYQTDNGMFHVRPELECLNKARGRVLQSAAALGMSPVSRKRLPGNANAPKDDNDEWLKNRARK